MAQARAAALAFDDDGEGAFGAGEHLVVGGGALGEFGVEFSAGGVGFIFEGGAEEGGVACGPGDLAGDDLLVEAFEDAVVEEARVKGIEFEEIARAKGRGCSA